MLPLFLLVVNNKNKYKLNSDIYNINTRQKWNFTNLYQTYQYIKNEST
jgi:hypothetical protein